MKCDFCVKVNVLSRKRWWHIHSTFGYQPFLVCYTSVSDSQETVNEAAQWEAIAAFICSTNFRGGGEGGEEEEEEAEEEVAAQRRV